jgi:hypothetical protein
MKFVIGKCRFVEMAIWLFLFACSIQHIAALNGVQYESSGGMYQRQSVTPMPLIPPGTGLGSLTWSGSGCRSGEFDVVESTKDFGMGIVRFTPGCFDLDAQARPYKFCQFNFRLVNMPAQMKVRFTSVAMSDYLHLEGNTTLLLQQLYFTETSGSVVVSRSTILLSW